MSRLKYAENKNEKNDTPSIKNYLYTLLPSIIAGVIGLIVNLLLFTAYQKSPFSTFLLWDAASYWEWALRIAGGDWLGGTTVFHQPPLYPYLLALFITIFGKTLTQMYLFQAALSAATAAMVCRLTVSITGSRKTGLVAGLLFAFYGMQVFYTSKILSEGVAAFLLVLAALLMTSGKMRVRTVAAGCVMGGVLLVKPHFLMALPFLFGYYLLRRPDEPYTSGLKHAVVFIVATGMVVSIATIRNFAVAKNFTLISANGGENFYIGNNEHANGAFVPVKGISSDIAFQNEDFVARVREHTGKEMSRGEVSQYWYRMALSWIQRHTADYLRLEFNKLLHLFSGAERSNMYLLSFEQNSTTPLLRLALVNWYLLFPFFLAGCFASIGFRRRLYPSMALLGVNVATMLLFFVDERFRVVTMPFVIIISGIGVVHLGKIIASKTAWRSAVRQPFFVAFVAGLALLAAIYFRDRHYPDQEWRMQVALGDIAYGKGDVDVSLDHYIKASAMNKTACMPAFMVSKAMFSKGYRDVAAQLYRTTMSTVGDDDRRSIGRDRDFDLLREYLEKMGENVK